jgi:hypothetical protein
MDNDTPVGKKDPVSESKAPSPRFGWLEILGIVAIATTVATVVALWAVKTWLFPTEFKPVKLSVREEQVLNAKLERLDSVEGRRRQTGRPPAEGKGARPAGSGEETRARSSRPTGGSTLKPERYSESPASREIVLTQKEINGLLAKNTDLAKRLAVHLSKDQISVKLLVPLDEDFPLFGGKTFRASAGVELAFSGGRPVVALKGISVWGVPLPGAWLGGLKNVDLVKEFGDRGGFWSVFSAGVDDIRVEEGSLRIRLKE